MFLFLYLPEHSHSMKKNEPLTQLYNTPSETNCTAALPGMSLSLRLQIMTLEQGINEVMKEALQ